MTEPRLVPTPHGEARLWPHRAKAAQAELVLTHGAGGGVDARDLQALAAALPVQGFAVTLVEMPWRVAGRTLAPRPQVIDECYRAVMASLRTQAPKVIGGRSAGARSACRIGAEVGAKAVLALSFPLHPPGRPERSRVDELIGAGLPTLVVQGGRDPFGRPEEFPRDTLLTTVPAADHGLKVPARAEISQQDALAVAWEAVVEWLGTLAARL